MNWKKIGSAALSNNLVPIVLIVLAGFAYLRYAPEAWKPWNSRPPEPAHQAMEPKVVTKIERITVPGPTRIEYIDRVKYIEKMPDVLQPATVANPEAQVIASAEIAPHSGKVIATTILETGVDNVARGRVEIKEQKAPFLAIQKEFGLRAGAGTGGLVIGEVYAHPVRVGPVTVEVRGFVRRDNLSGADFGGAVLADYRF